MGRARLDEFLSTIKQSGYAVRRNEQMTQWVMPGDSWTENPRAARRYARLDEEPRRDRWSVILRVEGEQVGESFAGIGPLVQAIQSESRKKIVPPVASEAEWVLRIGHLLRVRKVREDRNSRTVTIDLTPAGKASIDFPVRPPSR
jgi:hypothetical protein